MRSYRVSDAAFYGWFSSNKYDPDRRIELAVEQLVKRYGIENKAILSIGGGWGIEEYFLLKRSNRLTVVDIDERKDIEPALQKAPPGDFHYIVGDANDVDLTEQFDVLFLSSFAPDEHRRDAVARQRGTDCFQRMLKLNDGIWEWPWWEDPFHPAIMKFTRNIRPGGLMIVQSYAGGLDALDNRYYLWACDRQLATAGMKLIEVYRFAKTTGVMLYVISKGDSYPLPLFPPITRFHGRGGAEKTQCLRLFSSGPVPMALPAARPMSKASRLARKLVLKTWSYLDSMRSRINR